MADLTFSTSAIANGIAKAKAVWNAIPTDFPLGDGTYLPLATDDGYVADAGYAYAVLAEAARIDGQKMPFYGGGAGEPIQGDPVPNLTKALPAAFQTVKDYTRWAMETKPKLTAKVMGI